MRISLNWLKKYVTVPESVSDKELIRLIGARLVEVEGVIDEAHKYDNIYVVRVESCEKIPETHLSLCRINVGMVPFRGLPEVTIEDEGASPVTTAPWDADELRSTGASDPSREKDHPTFAQVVCGAPNVREGMLAVWIAPGAVVPASVHEDAPFVIGKRKMRGYESYGMLAGADELDFDDKHEKIAEIDPTMAKPGDKFADVFDLNDKILEIENKSLTHRPDCFGIIGFAREVAGILGVPFAAGIDTVQSESERVLTEPIFSDVGLEFSSTSYAGRPGETALKGSSLGAVRNIRVENSNQNFIHPKKQASATRSIQISSLDPAICSRYTAIILEKHGELKKKYLTWEDTILSKSGMRPVDPIVDATNYLMLLTGQPLHAFDYDKFVKVGGGNEAKVEVRLARKGEKLVLLDEREVALTENDIVICSNDRPVALAGAMGGKSTAIGENTRKIILESATFSLYNLRKTQMTHGIFSEAITRFTKGQPSYQTLAVAEECAAMLADGFKVVEAADECPKPGKQGVVKIATDEINGLLGADYDEDLIVRTLSNVGFRITFAEDLPEVTTEDEGASPATAGASDPCPRQMVIEIPLWRTDIHIKEDIIEEVGRLLGYDNIEPILPLHGTPNENAMWNLKRNVRETLARFGANEVLTYSFVSERLLGKAGQDAKNSYKIVNSISPELQYVRQSLMPSLLEKVYLNEKMPVEKFAIFEMNKVNQKKWGVDKENVPIERLSLGLVVAERKNNETAFYKAKKYLYELMERIGVKVVSVPLRSREAEYSMYEPKRAAEIRLVKNEEILLGVIGEFKNSVRHEFKLAPYAAGFEVDMELLAEYCEDTRRIEFRDRKSSDVTVTTDKTYAEALQEIKQRYPDAVITPSTIYQAEGQLTRNITFHIEN